MAVLETVLEPPRFASAYKPILWGFTSMRHPNVLAGESGIAINTIAVAVAADVVTYGSPLEVGDVFVLHSTITLGTIAVGQAVEIAGTSGGTYSGIYHVLKVVSTAVTVIDAEPIGSDSGGVISKYYENYHLVALVTMRNPFADTGVPIKRVLTMNQEDNIFYLDVRDIAQRSFHDVFVQAVPGEGFPLSTDGEITQEYSIFVYEAYMVPDDNGINVYTEFSKGLFIQTDEMVAVNSVQPYHHIDEENGGTDLLWENDLTEYIVDINTTNPDEKRFLTYAPRGIDQTTGNPLLQQSQLIGLDDDAYLAILWGGDVDVPLMLTVANYDVDDVIIGAPINIDFVSTKYSMILPVGPRNMTGVVDPAAHHYKVGVRNEDEFFITERLSFEIDPKCYTAPRRLHWINEFGAVDSFTFAGAELLEDTVERFTQTKPHMAIDLVTATRRGDWQRRTFRTESQRKRSAKSRTLRRAHLRWLSDSLLKSPDVRTTIYVLDLEYPWTWVEILSDSASLGYKGGSLNIEYQFGVDNIRQVR